jgi:hypothetical protein
MLLNVRRTVNIRSEWIYTYILRARVRARVCLCDNGDDVTAQCVAKNCDALEYLLKIVKISCLGDTLLEQNEKSWYQNDVKMVPNHPVWSIKITLWSITIYSNVTLTYRELLFCSSVYEQAKTLYSRSLYWKLVKLQLNNYILILVVLSPFPLSKGRSS